MAADKYFTLIAGRDSLVSATQTSAGAANADEIVALDASGRLDSTLMPVGFGADTKIILASEALSAGSYVNIFDNAGTANCRLADNSNDRPAHGFVLTAVLIAANATVYFEGPNSALSGLVAGQRRYLGTAGTNTATPLAVAGLHQFLGVAISATEINTDIDDEVVRV